jgi:hypothetical protein
MLYGRIIEVKTVLYILFVLVYGHVVVLDYIRTSVTSRSLKLLDLALLPSLDITNKNTGIPPLFSVSPEPVKPTLCFLGGGVFFGFLLKVG